MSTPIDEGPLPAWLDRLIAVAIVGTAVLCVVVLAGVHPDLRGHGTHEQLGLDPCGWPSQYGIPCPTCGVTTAACHLVHLSPWQSVRTQPFGFALAVSGMALGGLALWALVRGRSLMARMVAIPYGTLLGWGMILLLLSWLYVYLTW